MNDLPLLEQYLERWEQAWQRDEAPDLLRFWAGISDDRIAAADRPGLLRELIKIDLEYRWSRLAGQSGRLEDYSAQFRDLGPLRDWPNDLIVEEWIARSRWGDRPAIGDQLLRFPGRPALETELQRAEEELQREWREPASVKPANPEAFCPDPRAPLDYRDFVLIEFIGSGGMGKVYRASPKGTGRTVAVKMLRKSRWRLPGAMSQFLHEAQTLARLRHSGIVAVHGAGQTPGGGLFLVMDWIDGANLEEVATSAPPTPIQAAGWIAQILPTLDYAHRQGVVHCDLKPSNLLRDQAGRIHLGDFGLATSLNALPGIRRYGGTPGYMAPEQFDAQFGPIGPATDIFAVGLILLRLLTGETIFHGRAVLDALLEQGRNAAPWPESAFTPAVPTVFQEVLAGCLALEPAERIQSASALAELLGQVLADSEAR